MDNFDFKDEQPVKRPGSQFSLWDMLSILVLIITLFIGGYFALIFINPNTPLNPLPPASVFGPPTATIGPIQLQPTWTATTFSTTPTGTLAPLITIAPSNTPVLLVPPTRTPQPTNTPKAPFSSSLNTIESVIIPHLIDQGCNWQGVGGTVDDANNSPIVGMVVRIVGTLGGKIINVTTVSGVSPDYGKSGFEFVLGTAPVASSKTLYVQLLDQAGLPLADNVYITTYNDCKKNLTLIRFKKNR
ncbi:MAG: hypothetical protein HYR70_04880 [Chloroflexi bacterium]|nr:hypothetical protein [Chloroflexota bacterium]MBI3338516.1 hypothetical protein [Chloroflexota bacterium]